MIDFKINVSKNMKVSIYIIAIIAVLLGAIYMFYFYDVKEGLQSTCIMPPDIINTAMRDNVNNDHYYESKTPLSGNCYWPLELSDGRMIENKKGFKYCPLTCPENGENAKCIKYSTNCGKQVIGAFFDNVTEIFKDGSKISNNLKNNWVIKVRDNISNNIQKTLTNACELSYNKCESACKMGDVSCRNACEDVKNACEYKKMPGFVPNLANSASNPQMDSLNRYNSGSIYYPGNNSDSRMKNSVETQNPFNNIYTGANNLGGGFNGIRGSVNPITGNVISPEDFNSQSNLLLSHQGSGSPFGVFKEFLKNLVKEVQDESSVGVGRISNDDNPFLCDYIKSSASPTSQSYIQSNPANQTYLGFNAGIAPFF